jgi:hypothetical protein
MTKISCFILLLAAVACVAFQHRGAQSCFLVSLQHAQYDTARSREPRWLRLTRVPADTTGAAEVGLYGSTIIVGRWWRLPADSLRVDAGAAFDGVWLRLHESRDSMAGTILLRTDVDIRQPELPVRTWTAIRGPCPRN